MIKINIKIAEIAIFTLLFLIVVLLRIPTLFEPHWYGDEGVTITVAQRLFAGDTIYQDVYDNKPPLLYVLFGLAQNLFWIKVLTSIWVVATFVLVWNFAKKIADRLGGNKLLYQVGASLLFIYLAVTPALEGNIANAEIFFILPIALAMFFIFESISKKLPNWEWFLAGFLFASATLFKIPAVFDFGAAVLFVLTVSVSEKKQLYLKSFSFLVLGFMLVWLITILGFLIFGDFTSFYKAIIGNSVGYIESSNKLIIPQGKLLLKFLILVIISLILIIRRKSFGLEKVLLFGWLAFAFAGTQLSGRSYTHYLIQAIIPFSLSAMLFLSRLKIGQMAESLVVIILFVVGSYFSTFQLQRNRQYYQNFASFFLGRKSLTDYQTWFDPRTERLYSLAEYLKNNSGPNDKIFIWGNEPDLYYLSKLKPATAYITAYHTLSVPGAKDQVLEILASQRPKFIVTIDNLPEKLPELNSIIAGYYLQKLTLYNATIWQLDTKGI